DGGLQVMAGSCLGGGTTVNWTASLAPPEDVLEGWARHHDLPHLQGAGVREAVEQVAASIRVNFEASPDNPQNAALRSGGEHLGRRVGTIARNVVGCEADAGRSCGFCGLGCRRGRKRGTLDTWIRRAVRAGARILPDTRVERVRSEAGRVTGVTALAA